MHAFIGTVPLTIIEAINFVVTNEIKDADLYLVKVFNNAESVGEKIRETGVFRNVIILEDILLTYPITLKKCVKVLHNAKEVINIINKKKYDYVYYNNSGFLINSIFYTAFYKGNKNISNIFLEHGFNSYINEYKDKPVYIKFLIRLFGLRCMDGSMLDEIYMFEPDLCQVHYPCPIRRMQKVNRKNECLKRVLNTAFSYSLEDNEYVDKRIILFEQGVFKEAFDKEKLWNEVLEHINKADAIIKAHPRQKESTLKGKGVDVSKNHTMPWELEILNNDITEKKQITIFSGTCISPKLMFDEEPTVILLYKLMGIDYSFFGEKILCFVDIIANQYTDKTKFFVPETYEELREYLKSL